MPSLPSSPIGDADAIAACEPDSTYEGVRLTSAFTSTANEVWAWHRSSIPKEVVADPQPPPYLQNRAADELIYVCHLETDYPKAGPPPLDGGEPQQYPHIVDLVDASGARANFFLAGSGFPTERPPEIGAGGTGN